MARGRLYILIEYRRSTIDLTPLNTYLPDAETPVDKGDKLVSGSGDKPQAIHYSPVGVRALAPGVIVWPLLSERGRPVLP
ncbi:hypothetical protein RRG08_053178 [Elysia crispata]|uniref:Uncharacterized protein n=1 Tax=Elysia crispata TaxID=231223 RepID=A0AAE0YQX5_9GAST|nr:hypothetical protein RRG08_053178 [Elysia crispata]